MRLIRGGNKSDLRPTGDDSCGPFRKVDGPHCVRGRQHSPQRPTGPPPASARFGPASQQDRKGHRVSSRSRDRGVGRCASTPPLVVQGGGGGHPSRDRGHHWIGSCRSRRCLAGATLQQLPPAPSLPPKAVPLSREQLCSRVRLWFPVVSPSFAPTPSLDAHFPFQGGGVRQGSCCLGGLGSRPRARCTFAFGWAGTVSCTQGVGGG